MTSSTTDGAIDKSASERRSGSPSHPGTAGIRNRQTASAMSPSETNDDWRSIAPLPPKTSEKPSTSRRFPITLPESDPRTTSNFSAFTAKRAMISSGAFPKVALRKPPMPGPVWCAACSVASPMSQARGMSATAASHRAGLRAIGPEDLDITEHFREGFEPLFAVPGTIEEIEYPGFVRGILGDFGIEVSDEELNRFLDAEHRAWAPARRLGSTTYALLEALRARGIRLGLVSNAFDPGWLLRRDLDQMGVGERLGYTVFSSEVGKRKPHPDIFRRALDALGVAPEEALFVGDRLYE